MKQLNQLSCVFLVLALVSSCHAQLDGPVVDTTYGPVRGANITMNSGDVIQAFMGIPFARAPVGDLRFEVKHRQHSCASLIT